MKRLFLLLVFINLGELAQAQIQLFTSWEDARSEVIKKNQNILIVLTGSEWCAPCVKMKKNVFLNLDFIQYVQENLIVLEINLPKILDLNSKVLKDYEHFKEKYQTNALPTLILVDSEGNKKIKIEKGTSQLQTVLEKLKRNN